jgi:hypothetical protein
MDAVFFAIYISVVWIPKALCGFIERGVSKFSIAEIVYRLFFIPKNKTLTTIPP